CVNVPVGADPRDDCRDDGVGGCLTDGFCDGTGACAVYARGTICRAQTCTASTVTHAALCDGDGTCGVTTNDSCGQYLCGSDGACDGAGACRPYSGATTCATATCAGSTAMPARTCNGAGVCLMALPVSCAPYQCGGSGACRTSCASDADCLAPNVCMGTTC